MLQLFVLACALMAACASPELESAPETVVAPAQCADSSVDMMSPGVLYLSYEGHRCTAFAIGAREVVTAAHCVVDQASLRVNGHAPLSVDIRERSDIAVLHMGADFVGTIFPVARLSPAGGDEVSLVGYGCTGVAQRRVLRARSDNNDPRRIGMRGCACHGDSGGPILNAAGEVVGVMSAGVTGEAFAADISMLDDL